MTDTARGLTDEEARSRLTSEGYNELPRAGRRSLARIAFGVLREPMFALLIGSGAVYLLLGDVMEASLLLVFASASILIAVVQESRGERTLEALRDLTSPRALVIRDGERRRIPGREVARGDIVVLSEGDRVPADSRLVEAVDLQTDESLLTGESVPVRKRAGAADEAPARPGGDDLPFVFSGSLVVRGRGSAEVLATGPKGEIGQIGAALNAIDSAQPRLAQETRRLVRVFAVFGFACCALTVILFGLTRGSWLDALLAGIAIGMSMLPEEFPLVLTVFTVMGARRIAAARVLTRRASAIETLGAANVLCVDKTGTLTENRMSIAALSVDDETLPIDAGKPPVDPATWTGKLRRLVICGAAASAPDPFDPMEKAFHTLRGLIPGEGSTFTGEPARVYGLRPDLLAVTQVWPLAGAIEHVVAAKGAPEAIAALCRLDPERIAIITRDVDRMAAEGLRVLAVAEARFLGSNWPETPTGFEFTWRGLVGLADPLRASVPAATRECRDAGIRVVMITGDYPATARAIAAKAGIATESVVSGDEIEKLSDEELVRRAASTSIFARVMPTHKLRIVQALKAEGSVVAMTGDGVNDAPSLKAADIGIAMGGRGTDVAREAAALVLLDDDFSAIPRTVLLGRRIYDNLRKAMGFILAVHIPIAGMALLPLLTGLPIIFSPIHIAFLEMIIDPVCSVVFEGEKGEAGIMRRPPRAATDRLFSTGLVVRSLLQGALALAVVAAVYVSAAQLGYPEDEVRALAFTTLVLVDLGLVLVNRSFDTSLRAAFRGDNPALYWVAGIAIGSLGVALSFEPARDLFRFGAPPIEGLIVAAAAAALLVTALEALKSFQSRSKA